MSLSLKNLSIYKQNRECLISELSFTVRPAQIMTLMGPSGCGKSTILNFIAGHLNDEFTATGDVLVDNISLTDTPAHRRNIGILFQDDFLFPHMTIWQNLAFALPNHIKGKLRYQHAMDTLESIQLQHLAVQHPHQLSGGQRARVSLMRMLLAKPKVVLLDEPFSKLDQQLREQFRHFVFDHVTKANLPTLMVTHDMSDAPQSGPILNWPWQQHQVRSHCMQ